MDRPKTRGELLSPSEWRIFWILCRRPRLTTNEVGLELSRLDPTLDRADNTVRTFLKRIQDKGYLKSEPTAGRERLYSPSVPFEAALKLHVHRFLDQFALGGQADLEILRQVVEEKLASQD